MYKNREISWLSFNERVLQEAANSEVPILERLKFLGIFSSNQDEFFRVRVAMLQRMCRLELEEVPLTGDDPKKVLAQVQRIALKHQQKFETIYQQILKDLEKKRIFIVNETQLTPEQAEYVVSYFKETVRPNLVPIMIDQVDAFQDCKDRSIYLAVKMFRQDGKRRPRYSLLEVPSGVVPRFLVLPMHIHGEAPDTLQHTIILLDDVIRYNLNNIFSILSFDTFEAYTIKITRDAELTINDALDAAVATSYMEKLSKSLKKRSKAPPVRFIYDKEMPQDMLNMLMRKLKLKQDDNLQPGGRYHNFSDFMKFPRIGPSSFRYPQLNALKKHPDFAENLSFFKVISKKDVVLHYPYQPFTYFIDLLREAAIDPAVESISITLYRAAKHSKIIHALINAAKNGKKVTAVIELQARFDEEANIHWSNKLAEEGVRVIYGVPNYKVHSKLCLIVRRTGKRLVRFGHVGTGNFNEDTARLYSDIGFFTSDTRITDEIQKLFNFFEDNVYIGTYKHLLVSPVFVRRHFETLIEREIHAARQGRPAYIVAKTNSLVDQAIIDNLYRASQAGVRIWLIVRGMCSLRPGVPGLSENITAISVIDKFLEHARIFVFCNGGAEKYYISSADWMTRNLDHRVEAACPIYDPEIRHQLRVFLSLQLRDNTKARIVDARQTNRFQPRTEEETPLRCQDAFFEWLRNGTLPEGPRPELPLFWTDV
ncbi:polyphosphate kinase 1 [bacterium (Candidatus Blackallbacteria) CG17_big_fil_post_rev_8_21_14_2_50_48_46]|uniref:Polyphosphate kinase n=1 Tax=bacterium (Candidatus Blackallbacteria) CG17_big_fil_post_rev_8_21_14_2_50_48_46 TaxID=2014261 RepID=A0A2M7FZN3_9BACT|nr:MAG: polyphosphate kinase 1 [bacterium (Candidatus Blackallbacteria) CG18_big_fil_WC_8_21_14_2_50_49_26]PIW14872.1 MAG: polyphosphate kinase 1 [bacterium (Candidatus Blackallbacteria) CG17_big_fil_post_rev_8_21_14_2_50_48_46]PIW44439.1 MAG: polyphosphate kinase 1 [bacterium (Candidatus Blackallbacteria) CG13_big_fil_rev_8_21_14_2_50_49_14]